MQPRGKKVIAHIVRTYGVSEDIAEKILEFGDVRYQSGLKDGRDEAQRFFRLALGVEAPTTEEAALWNNPVPLKNYES